MTEVRLERVSVAFGDHLALRDVDLMVRSGECVLVAGPSGSGKSTLVRRIAGLVPQCIPAAVSGDVLLDGRSTQGVPVAEVSRHVGVVFQNPRTQLLNVRVEDEVGFGPRNLGLPNEEIEQRVARSLAAVGLTGMRRRTTAALSGGERQRLAIAAVLAMGPRVLLLDEPMASLDVHGTRTVTETVRRLNREDGVTVVIVEHRLGPAAAIAGRTVLLDGGRVVADGATEEVLARRDLLRRLGLRRPSDDHQVAWRELVCDVPPAPGPAFVRLEGVCAGPHRHDVLHELDLTLRRGEFVALVGDNGAGKTTLARVLAGLLRPRRGTVSYPSGRRPKPGSGVGMLFQDPSAQLLCDTVEEEVWYGPRNLGRRDPGPVEAAIDAVDLADQRHRPVFALSLGQQQRLAVAGVLATRPDLLILDEPTVGQDWAHMGRFMAAVRELNAAGTTVVLITHDFKLVHHHASRIVVLHEGRVVADGVPVDVVRGRGGAAGARAVDDPAAGVETTDDPFTSRPAASTGPCTEGSSPSDGRPSPREEVAACASR